MEDYLNVIPLLRIAEFTIRLDNPGEQAIAPIVKADKDNISIMGLALFKEDKMVGKLDYDEMQYYFLTAQNMAICISEWKLLAGTYLLTR